MKKFLFFSFCFFIINIGFAQDTIKPFIVKWVASAFLPNIFIPDGINISLGAEYNYKKKNSISCDIGYIINSGNLNNFIEDRIIDIGILKIKSNNIEGFTGNVELRHYFKRDKLYDAQVFIPPFWPSLLQLKNTKNSISGYYWGGNINYQFTSAKRNQSISNYPQPGYYDNLYTVNRSVIALHCFIGFQSIRKKGFVLDQFFGIGARFITSYSINKKADSVTDYEIFGFKEYDSGYKLVPSITYRLKIGWLFK